MNAERWLALRTRVLADLALQARLWPLDAAAFRQALAELGAPAEGPWPWDPGPLSMPLGPPAPLLDAAPAGPGWVPTALDLLVPGAALVWRQTGCQSPRAPLYLHDDRAWGARPLNRFLDVRTTLPVLDEPFAAPEPAGVVFHMSRCGSTLVSRMLAEVEGVVALSEPPLIGDILRLPRLALDLDADRQAAWLRHVVARCAPDGGAVLKTEAGGLFSLAVMRRAFPAAPWIFLHRDPLDVMLSQQRDRAPEMMPIMIQAALPAPPEIDLDEHCARTLGALCNLAADAIADGEGSAIAYGSLPEAVETRIAPLFGLSPGPSELDGMRAIATRDARRGEAAFVDDQTRRRAGADRRLVELADQLARPAWRRLQARAAG